jgi:hypothetical protein
LRARASRQIPIVVSAGCSETTAMIRSTRLTAPRGLHGRELMPL